MRRLLWPAALIVTFLLGWAVAGVTRYTLWARNEVVELRETMSRQQQQVATLQARLHARESLATARSSSGESASSSFAARANEVMSATMTSARAASSSSGVTAAATRPPWASCNGSTGRIPASTTPSAGSATWA